MTVSYTAKAIGDITCIAETDAAQWTSADPNLPVRVRGVARRRNRRHRGRDQPLGDGEAGRPEGSRRRLT